MKTGCHLIIKVGTEIGPLSDRKTTIVVVGYDCISSCHLTGISHVAIFKSFPFILVGTDGPVETWIQLTSCGTLLLEEVVQPWRS